MPRHPFTPGLDPLEPRLALSTLSTSAYREAKAAVRHALADLGRTGNLQRATAAINRAASRIPLASPLLLPLWKAELASVSGGVPSTRIQARRDMFLALDLHLHRGVEAGAITVKGPASRQVSRPAVHALDGATAFINRTSYTLSLNLSENQSGRVIFAARVESDATLYFRPPADALPTSSYTLAVSTRDGSAPLRSDLRDLANTAVAFLDGLVPGTVAIRVLADGF